MNTGSITGLQGSKELLDYSSTKGAIHAFTKALAQNLVEKENSRELRCAGPGIDKPAERWQSTARRRRYIDGLEFLFI